MPREYRHIEQYAKEIVELQNQGFSQKQIGEKLYRKQTTRTDHQRGLCQYIKAHCQQRTWQKKDNPYKKD